MKTFKKDFDCIEMKNALQARVYAETKDMSFEQYRLYLDNSLKNDTFWQRISAVKKGSL